MRKKYLVLALLLVCLVFVGVAVLTRQAAGPTTNSTGTQSPANLIAAVAYTCDAGKTISAAFYRGVDMPPATPGSPPRPGGSVKLTLGDGRALTLSQTISADGARYANADESFVFWSRGEGAFIEENGTQTFTNCEGHNVVGAGEACGGNMTTAPICATGYHCAPRPGSRLPFGDVGGICTTD